MDTKIFDFLTHHRVCSLTTLLNNGYPHAAALHYSHKESPLELYFSTEKTGLKTQALLDGKSTKGSVVIGFCEEEWVTLQMDGKIKAIFDSKNYKKRYHNKETIRLSSRIGKKYILLLLQLEYYLTES